MPSSRIETLSTPPLAAYQQAMTTAQTWLRLCSGEVKITRLVGASNKSIVWEVRTQRNLNLILKKHFRRQNFDNEIFALECLAHTHRVPQVSAFNEDLHLILMTALQPTAISEVAKRCAAMVEVVAHVHSEFLHSQELRRKILPGLTLSSMEEPDSQFGDLFRSRADHLYFSKHKRSVFGDNYISFAVFDIKPDHFMHNAGSSALVDFDASAPGLYEEYDLLSLTKILAPYGWTMEDIATHYSTHRKKADSWPSPEITLNLMKILDVSLA